MPISWTPRLAVGVQQIDDEHKELFDRINTLLDAMANARAKEQVKPLVDFLSAYVESHFGGEARLMALHDYPGRADHLAQHAFFVAEFRALVGEMEKGGVTALLTIKLNKLLCDWLRDHVSTVDRKLGEFLATAKPTLRA